MNTVKESFYYRDTHNIVAMIHVVQVFFPIISCALFIGFFVYYWVIIKGSEGIALNEKEWSTVAAYYLVSFYFTLFVFCLDCAAVHYRRVGTEFITDSEVIKNFVITPMIFDGLAVIFIVALLFISKRLSDHTKWQLICLGLAGLAPLLCIASHAHLILIAWITGPVYAYGIGVFYVIMSFVYFFTFKFLYYIYACYGCCGRKKSEEDQKKREEDQKKSKGQKKFSYEALISPFVIGLFLTGFFLMIACFIVLIPISKSIEDAPRQVSAIYQSISFVLSVLVGYIIIKPIPKEG